MRVRGGRRAVGSWRGLSRRCLGPALAALGVAVAFCAIATTPALAAGLRFGSEGEGAGQFRNPKGISINQENGEVYIADEENNRVDQFRADGAFLRTWGFGVADGSSEAFQICEAPARCFAGIGGAEGAGGGQLALPNGTAVDNSAGLAQGDVYVEDPFHHRIERYDPEGKFILAFGGEVNKATKADVCLAGEECGPGTPGTGPSQFEALEHNAIAVGPTGTVYVGDLERVKKFSSGGAPEGEIPLPAGAGVVEALAVDSSGDIYVLSTGLEGVRKYDGTGAELGEPRDPGAGGLAVSIALGAGDELLVGDPERLQRILEYDASGAQLGSFPQKGDANGGIALRQSTRELYVLREFPTRVETFALPEPGPLVLEGSESASNVLPTSATLNATVNPEEAASADGEVKYYFEYGETASYGTSTTVQGSPGEPFEDRSVGAAIEGLQPRTTYHFRVVVENAAKEVTLGPDQSFTTLPPVSIDSESAANVTATSAKLIAELNPHGLPSEYHFEYGLSSAYEKSAPVPDAEAGEGTTDATFSINVEGLQPQSVYHYRVVAHNALGVTLGPDQTFKTQGGELPAPADGRAWEMVSPPAKHGVSLEALSEEGGVVEAAAGGTGLAYIANGPIDEQPAGNRSAARSQLLARRTAAGVWSTQDIATPHQAPAGLQAGNLSEYKLFSSDLSRAIVQPEGATLLAPEDPTNTERTPYRREADGSYTPLVNAANVPAGTKFGGEEGLPEVFTGSVGFITATPDLAHALLGSPVSLVQGLETEGQQSLYEWSEGMLSPVSVLPNGASAAEEGMANVGNGDIQVRKALSADGRRAFFETTARDRLYMRDMQLGKTLRVDAAEAGLKEAEGGATFQLASPDGEEVLFTDQNKLTEDATARSGAPDLYECKVIVEEGELACELHDLSVDPHPGEAADVQGAVIGAGEDGRYVYYVAGGALAEGAASEGECPGEGEAQCANLYAYDTQAGSKRLVAVLSGNDFPDWRAGVGGTDLGEMTSRVSPNGRYVAFMSERPLTGYDNRDAHSGARDQEVFLYDHATNELRCASCDPSGQRPVGAFDDGVFPGLLVDRPRVWGGHWLAASVPGWTRVNRGHALHQPRYLADSGRLFFNSPGSLVAADGNGTQDVYEFEPNGVGGCSEPTGCVSLASSGTSSEESAFLDASESGDDVFFITAAQLSGADADKALDVYDAHVCTLAPGCAGPLSGKPPPCASSDACRAAPAAQPDIFGPPSSSTFSGAGNLTPPAAVKAKPLTRAQKLAKALRACKKKPKKARARCIRKAKARYGARRGSKKSSRARKRVEAS